MMNKERLLFLIVPFLVLALAGGVFAEVTAPTGGGKLAIGYDGTDATTNGTSVMAWNDQVGSYNAASPLPTSQPVLVEVDTGNGLHPVLDFDGLNDYLETAVFDSSFTQTNAYFLVASWDSLATRYFFDGIDGSNRNALYTRSDGTYGMFAEKQIINTLIEANTGVFQVFTAVFNGPSSLLRIDGEAVLSGDTGTQGIEGLTIGADRNTTSNGDFKIAELLVYDGGLDTSQILAIEDYLRNKYIVNPDADLASDPNPYNSDSLVLYDAILSWTAGASVQAVDGHDVYFGTSSADVADATLANPLGVYQGSQTATTFDPGQMVLGQKYYWRIDEVNGAAIWKGDVWNFTVLTHVKIENYESYADTAALLGAWSEVGGTFGLAISTDPAIDTQAMKIPYDNDQGDYYSAAQHSYAAPQDWTVAEVKALDLWFIGEAANNETEIYVEISDGTNTAKQVYSDLDGIPDLSAVQTESWIRWKVDLSAFAGVDLANITRVSLGTGDGSAPGQTTVGNIYFDGLELYPIRCLGGYPTMDFNEDCTVDFADFAIFSGGWLDSGLWPQ